MAAIATNADDGAGAIALKRSARFLARPFEPHPLFRNAHLATVAAAYWPREFASLPPAMDGLLEVEPGTRLLAKCNWLEAPHHRARLVLVQRLTGASDSPYMLGIAGRAH